MSGINFLSVNEVDHSQLSLTSGTVNSQFPLSNIQNDSPNVKFRSTTASCTILIDTLTTGPVDTIGIVSDALGNVGYVSATVKASTTTDFSSSTPTIMVPSSEFNMSLAYITSTSKRYWQIELVGSSYVEVSNIFLGERVNLPQNSISVASFSYKNEDRSDVSENKYGTKFINVRNRTKSLGGNIENCTKAETKTLDDMFQRHGKNKPLWLIVDKDNQAFDDGGYRFSVYGYLKSMPNWSAAGGQLFNTKIEVEEAV